MKQNASMDASFWINACAANIDGLARFRLEEAIQAYKQGEADLAAAARHASVSVYHMMSLLSARNIASPNVSDKFVEGLKTLVETFGGSDALRQTISEFESSRS